MTFNRNSSCLRARFVQTVLIALLLLGSVCILPVKEASAQNVRLAFEPAMRQIAARFDLFGLLGWTEWPGCDVIGDGPMYPPDGYYGDLTISQAITLVGSIRSHLCTLAPYFTREDWVASIEGTPWNELESDRNYHIEDFPVLTTPSPITAENYVTVFSDLIDVIPHLHYSVNIAGVNITSSLRGMSYNGAPIPASTCEEAWAEVELEFEEQAETVASGDRLGYTEFADFVFDSGVLTVTNAEYQIYSGTIDIWMPTSTHYSSTGQLYLTTEIVCSIGDKPPPVPGHVTGALAPWHAYATVNGTTSVGLFAPYTVGDYAFDCGNPPNDDDCNSPPADHWEKHGWYIDAIMVVMDSQFDAIPDDVDPCDIEVELSAPNTPPVTPEGEGNVEEGGGKESAKGPDRKNDCDEDKNKQETPTSDTPVSLAYGTKLLTATDLSIDLPGGDYSITRWYSSDTALGGSALVGTNWDLSAFRFITVETVESEPVLRLADGLRRTLWFSQTSSGRWTAAGPTTQHFVQADANGFNTWRLVEPGGWSMDFYRAGVGPSEDATPDEYVGLLAQERDEYGNRATYDYVSYGATSTKHARLNKITFFTNGSSKPAAEMWFVWNLGSDTATKGKLASIQVIRFDSFGLSRLTQQITYQYKTGSDGLSTDLGNNGDLIQVTQYTLVDAAEDGSAPFYKQVTQYRYHDADTTPSSSDERLLSIGDDHQLKMVIMPEQVEYFAQQLNLSLTVDASDGLLAGVQSLLALDDADTAFTKDSVTYKVVDLAAKVLSYSSSSGKVEKQFVQTGCGCSGGTQGLKLAYHYYSVSANPSVRITEYPWSGSAYSSTAYRTLYYDMERLGSANIPYLVTQSIIEPGGGGRAWVTHKEYDSGRRLTKLLTPSAAGTGGSAYVPADQSGGPSYSAQTNTGLVYVFVYNDENRRIETRVGNGDLGNDPDDYILVTRKTYPLASSLPADHLRIYLPTKIELWRTDVVPASSSQDEIETTTFAYRFHGDPQTSESLASMRTMAEAELESENGPSGSGNTYDTYDLYDTAGLNRWSRGADGSLSYAGFDPGTGHMIHLVRNANPAGNSDYEPLDSDDYGDVSLSGWGRFSDGGSAATTWAIDLLGRTTSEVSAGGRKTYAVRRLGAFWDRPGVYYLATISMPHQLEDDSFSGPAVVSWHNAGGGVIGQSSQTLDSSAEYAPEANAFTFHTTSATQGEIARTVTRQSPTGLATSTVVWHNVYGNQSYTSYFDYDALGRLEFVTSPTLSVSKGTYDVLGRVIKTEAGTTSTLGSLTTVTEYFYDSAQAAAQGVGNGNITLVRQHPGDTTLGLSATRDTKQYYDFRDRLTKVVNPAAPHQYVEYDNLDRALRRALFNSEPSSIATPLADRGIFTITDFSQRGMVFSRRVSTDASVAESSALFLESNYWHDQAGRIVATWGPDSAGAKRTYDGLGRIKSEFVTDRGDDAAPGTSGNYADALDVTGDAVLEQTNPTYNSNDRISRMTHWTRDHKTSHTGAFDTYDGSTPVAIATYLDIIYDSAGRRIGTINYGTNDTTGHHFATGASVPTVQTSLPSFTSMSFTDAVIAKVQYNSRGLVEIATDSTSSASGADRSVKYLYDDLSRRIAVIENYKDAIVEWNETADRWVVTSGLSTSALDEDRVTSFVYNGSSNVVKQVAHIPVSTGEDAQITEYVYGTSFGAHSTTTNSLVASNDLLKEVHYPNETTGDPDSAAAYSVKYAYNAIGELRSIVDQNTTRHEFTRDDMGRITLDHAATLGTGIDGAVRKIAISYDTFGRFQTVESKNGSNSVVNAVEFAYTPLWQVSRVYQDHNSAISKNGSLDPSGDTVDVRYTYSTSALSGAGSPGGGNYSRLDTFRHPDASLLYYGYGPSGSIDDVISRLSGVSRASIAYGSAAPDLVEYQYVGLGMFAVTDLAQPDIQLDRSLQADGTRATAGRYDGWDHLGRVTTHAWVDGNLTAGSGTGAGYPTRPPVFSESYHYDRTSNRTARWDSRTGASWADRDFKFVYDDLDRLVEAQRGAYSPGSGTMTFSKPGSQAWELDMLGNWKTFSQDGASNIGDGDYNDSNEVQIRLHNMANELYEEDRTAPLASATTIPLHYDDAGNLKDRKRTSTLTSNYAHDAWNRLVKVDNYSAPPFGSGTTTISAYEYNGLHWRTVKRSDTTPSANGLDQQSIMYYDASWRLVEERIDDNWTTSSSTVDRHMQNLWGARYLDDLIARRRDANKDGDYIDSGDGIFYALTDVQFSVVAMVSSAGKVHERVTYDAYGNARHHWMDDVDGDNDADSADKTIISTLSGKHIYDSSYKVEADLDRSGTIDTTDLGLVTSGTKAALTSGLISDRTATGPDNTIGYDGYVFNPENLLSTVRFRHYDPTLGRWIERDPAGYVSGLSLYEAMYGSPSIWTDPSGLEPDTLQWHHRIPQSDGVKALIRDIGDLNIDSAEYGRLMRQADHCGKGEAAKTSRAYSKEFEKRLREIKETKRLTKDDVVGVMKALEKEDLYKKWQSAGIDAAIDHKAWEALSECERLEEAKKTLKAAIKNGKAVPTKLLELFPSLRGISKMTGKAASKAASAKRITKVIGNSPVVGWVMDGFFFYSSVRDGKPLEEAIVDCMMPVGSVEDFKELADFVESYLDDTMSVVQANMDACNCKRPHAAGGTMTSDRAFDQIERQPGVPRNSPR